MESYEKLRVLLVMHFQKTLFYRPWSSKDSSEDPPALEFNANQDIEKTEQNIFHPFRLSSVLSRTSGNIKNMYFNKI